MSRRDQIRMTQEELLSFLKDSKTAILTSIGKDGYPHPMPMWYCVEDDGCVVFTTFRKSQKVKNLEANPRVGILVESGEEYAQLKGVLIHSTAEIVDDLDTALATMIRLAGGDSMTEDLEALENLRNAVRPTALKRVVIRCAPEKFITWDHAKLQGKY
jgi:PPOX class probable F420-dependent enzyme